jgi:hypothetical protein
LIREHAFRFPFPLQAMDAEISSDVVPLIFRNDNKGQQLFLFYPVDE